MAGQFYDNPERTLIHLDLAAVAGGGDLATLAGPAGKVGRVTRLGVAVTTAFTVADSVLSLDSVTPSLTTPPSLTIPFTGSAIGDNVEATRAALNTFSELPADTVLQLASDGGSTAGAGSVTLQIDWY
jgi:hypothetical protein